MNYLIFQLQGPLVAWGDTAVGEYRGSLDTPGESALVGLLAAALGMRRDDEAKIAAIRDGYHFAVGVQAEGQLLRDYHTAQVPSRSDLKGRPHASRRDELLVPKNDLNTVLSTRDYRQNGAWLVAVQEKSEATFSLKELDKALREPKFVLYLGRKSCPPAAPLNPRIVDVATVVDAFKAYCRSIKEQNALTKDKWGRLALEEPLPVKRLHWNSESINPGITPMLTTPRKDRLIRRRGWLFGDRMEHRADIKVEAESCTST